MGHGLPCTGGCGCFTDRTIEGILPNTRVAFCIWCEDGVTCPQGQSFNLVPKAPAPPAPVKPVKLDAAAVDRRTEERRSVQAAAPAKETREVMAEKKCAGFEGEACDVVLGDTNVTGLCTRHYARRHYRLNHPKKDAARVKTAKAVKRVSAAMDRRVSALSPALGGGVVEQFDSIEQQVNGMFTSLPLDVKVRLLREHLGR